MTAQQKSTQQSLHQRSCQEQATHLVQKAIDLQHQVVVLLKQATSLEMQASALLTDQAGPQKQSQHTVVRSMKREEDPFAWSVQDDDDDWEEWVAARFVLAGDA